MKLKEYRWLEGWDQKTLAEKIGTTQVDISRVENNVRKPSNSFIQKFINFVGKKETFKIDEFKNFKEDYK